MLNLQIPETKRKILEKRGIENPIDLCFLFPYKYYYFPNEAQLLAENIGNYVCVRGTVYAVNKKNGKGISMIDVRIRDAAGQTLYVKFFHQGNRYAWLAGKMDEEVYVCGQLGSFHGYFTMADPIIFSEDRNNALGFHPVYPKYRSISAEYLKQLTEQSLEETALPETIPQDLLKKTGLPGRKEAVLQLHHPSSPQELRKAIQRQVFEDLLYYAIGIERQNREISKGSAFNVKTRKLFYEVLKSLPYQLTEDQKNVTEALLHEMEDGKHVSALIQGDVGCGKSIVAFLLMIAVAGSGYQAAIMAPTQVLARQHYDELSRLATPLGLTVGFLGGGQTKKERTAVLKNIEDGSCSLIVGTQALIGNIPFSSLGLAIVDEEHRFGVYQREALAKQAREGVHMISFSATPIPRTMAQAMYGDHTDIYEIKSMPPGRKPIHTVIDNSDRVFDIARQMIGQGRQVYVVCPLIDDETGDSKLRSVDQVAKEYREKLQTEIGTLTGRQSKKETEEILNRFHNGDLKVLVATTVIEVGINVPNATLMIIEDAYMFGLAQLHQLRGRVGRGQYQGICVLRTDRDSDRLQVMCETTDGFKIAERDLMLRGQGNILGEEQSGKNRYMQECMDFPNMFRSAKVYAAKMVDSGDDESLVAEMEKRSEKIYLKMGKMKYFGKC